MKVTGVIIQVRSDIDVFAARAAAKRIALEMQLPSTAVHELVIVTSELAWNLVKHAGGGVIEVQGVDHDAHGPGVRIRAGDHAPPFRDLKMAIRDGWDDCGPIDPGLILSRGGLGGGLGAVVRLTDSFAYEAREDGKHIEVIRYGRRPKRPRPSQGPPAGV